MEGLEYTIGEWIVWCTFTKEFLDMDCLVVGIENSFLMRKIRASNPPLGYIEAPSRKKESLQVYCK